MIEYIQKEEALPEFRQGLASMGVSPFNDVSMGRTECHPTQVEFIAFVHEHGHLEPISGRFELASFGDGDAVLFGHDLSAIER